MVRLRRAPRPAPDRAPVDLFAPAPDIDALRASAPSGRRIPVSLLLAIALLGAAGVLFVQLDRGAAPATAAPQPAATEDAGAPAEQPAGGPAEEPAGEASKTEETSPTTDSPSPSSVPDSTQPIAPIVDLPSGAPVRTVTAAEFAASWCDGRRAIADDLDSFLTIYTRLPAAFPNPNAAGASLTIAADALDELGALVEQVATDALAQQPETGGADALLAGIRADATADLLVLRRTAAELRALDPDAIAADAAPFVALVATISAGLPPDGAPVPPEVAAAMAAEARCT